MEQWKEINATEFCYHITDGTHDSPKAVPEGKFLITSKHIKNDQIDFDSAYKISEEDYFKIVSRSKVDKWDIIISMIGAYCGFCYLQDNNQTDFAIKNVGLFKVGEEYKCKWLYYYLTSPQGKQQLAMMRSGSSQPYIALNSLRNLKIPCPSKEIMVAVVSILDSIDKKIRLNRQINDNLEQQAQALFKSWFVDFEPFKDGEFVNSELGMIPKGWEVTNLGNVTTECKEKVGNREDVKVLSPVTTGELLLSEEYFTKQVFSDSIAKYIVVKPTEFAYNPARVNIGSLGINTFDFDGCVSPVYVVFRTEPKYHHFFNLFRKRESFKTEINSRAIGGVRQTLNYKDFSLISLIYPPIDVIEDFNEIYSSLLHQIDNSKEENKKLSQLRDTLLPRLMSGELKINEINC